MLVESIIQRESGTHVKLGDSDYHFLPDSTGKHVCEVENPEHCATLLAIIEGYREIKKAKSKAKVEQNDPPATDNPSEITPE